jgi:hypothetical protein
MVLLTGRPFPPPGPRGRVPRLLRYYERLRLLIAPTSLRHPYAWWFCRASLSLPSTSTRRRGPGAFPRCSVALLSTEAMSSPRFLGDPNARMPRSWTPAGPQCQVVATPQHGLPDSGRRRLPQFPCFEARSRGLRAPCLRFARTVACQDARLGSAWLTRPSRAGDIPLGPSMRFQSWIMTSSSSRLFLAQPDFGGGAPHHG